MPEAAPTDFLSSLGVRPGFWMDGRWQDGMGEGVPVHNPATGIVLATVPAGGAEDFRRAIDGAHRAFARWSREPNAFRGDILKRTASLMLAKRQLLAEVITREQGKPLAQALGEVDYSASFFQWFGEEARRDRGRLQPHPELGRQYLVAHVAAGVAGLITPWNFPLAQGSKKVAAALAAGCTVVWKPSELTPLVALALGPILQEAGLPEGVVQIIPAYGPAAGQALTEDARVRVLSLTGSTRTGRYLLEASAKHIQRVALELGGNAPFVVLPDADLDRTADDLVKLKMLVSGQVCVTANRVYVPAAREAAFTEKLAQRWEALRVGNGMTAGMDGGPLIHAQACERVRATVEGALKAGATLVAENRSQELDPDCARGSYSPPTILRGVQDSMPLVQEEIFGPVVPLMTYSDLDDVVRRANATPYGLAAYVYGTDLAVANRVAGALDAGIVGVNEWRPLRAEIPFGGVKYSGLGSEGGEEGIREFSHPKVIATGSL